ncbi:hypothetical protein SG34_033260 [Thalassomonas viridans]|uniref:Uncharacterized protein n=1 Tax=Thalassomonas viridans TaxID=137584 RepID=A0AAE9Z8M2_9GAMM|nr:hypothetical protein [Thalassomonas viridans]WDE08770.1 hypothetical protein SG34_033260 [Thalassomonas viridans]
MTHQDPLCQLVEMFEQWRATRLNRNAPTPMSLRQQALLLTNTYPSDKIATTLRISGGQLKQWREAGGA